jgi:hypothetical protein
LTQKPFCFLELARERFIAKVGHATPQIREYVYLSRC